MRAKFKCNSVTDFGIWKQAKLNAVYSGDKNSEDNQFSQSTPSGNLEISISNPNESAQNFFKPGNDYYLDFTEAPKE